MALEAQRTAQSSIETTRHYEEQIAAMQHKMSQVEQLVVTQCVRSQKLESQLSATQDRIGGAERKARLLENENQKIQGELQFWNEVYQQDTDIARSAPSIPSMTQSSISMPMSIPFTPISLATVDLAVPMNIPASGPAMTMTLPMSLSFASFASETYGLGLNVPNEPIGHRDSFGSVFPRSQGNIQDSGDGNGGHNGHSGFHDGSTGLGQTM